MKRWMVIVLTLAVLWGAGGYEFWWLVAQAVFWNVLAGLELLADALFTGGLWR